MNSTKDELFKRTWVRFLSRTVFGQTLLNSRSNSELLEPLFPKNWRVNTKKKNEENLKINSMGQSCHGNWKVSWTQGIIEVLSLCYDVWSFWHNFGAYNRHFITRNIVPWSRSIVTRSIYDMFQIIFFEWLKYCFEMHNPKHGSTGVCNCWWKLKLDVVDN